MWSCSYVFVFMYKLPSCYSFVLFYNVLVHELFCFHRFPGVQFFKTTVTYQSLGESLQPNGHADNFFMAVVYRKYFEDHHPRLSKKHYFYPRIGVCAVFFYWSFSSFFFMDSMCFWKFLLFSLCTFSGFFAVL